MPKSASEPRSSEITPESHYLGRREFLRNAGLAVGTAAVFGGGLLWLVGKGPPPDAPVELPPLLAVAPAAVAPTPTQGTATATASAESQVRALAQPTAPAQPQGQASAQPTPATQAQVQSTAQPQAPAPTPEPAPPAYAYTKTDEPQTSYESVTTYNNFYEFGLDKADPAAYAHTLKPRPWTISVEGEVAKPQTIDIETLLKWFPLQERVYWMRCVEAWSMVIPWVGFPLGDLIKKLEPTSKAKYVEMVTLMDPVQMPGQEYGYLEWPYVEGLRMDEALHPLTILAAGLYGRELPNQNGAPLRLVVPWKYGFKGVKSIVKIRLVETQPATTWALAAPYEYGFYANVNPEVDHPRWSQASERRIGDLGRRPTLPFNGYAEEVAHLYAGMDLRQNF